MSQAILYKPSWWPIEWPFSKVPEAPPPAPVTAKGKPANLALTAIYDSKAHALGGRAGYKISDGLWADVKFSIKDNKIDELGIDYKPIYQGRLQQYELWYNPAKDSAKVEVVVRPADKIGAFSRPKLLVKAEFEDIKRSYVKKHSERFEVSAVVPKVNEKVTLGYDIQSKEIRGKVEKRLGDKNEIEVTCVYQNKDKAYMKAELKHAKDQYNVFKLGGDFGSNEGSFEWISRVSDGRWKLEASFPFKEPNKAEFTVSRRFELSTDDIKI